MPKEASGEELTVIYQENEKFERALGQLMTRWADAESALYSVLRYYAKVSDDVGRSIFSGCRAKTMMEFLDNIAHNTQLDERRRDDLTKVFAQLTAINTMRDRLVHHVDGSEIQIRANDLQRRVLSNAHRVSRKGKAFDFEIGSVDIENMNSDLRLCCWHLINHLDGDPKRQFTPYPGEPIAPLKLGKPYAWRYKSPQPNRPDSKNASSPRKPPRQPKSSRQR
jgi:hypothetical protein